MDPRPRLDIRLLGELTVLVDATVVPIPGRQQRALLTLLAFRANHVIPNERLIEALWGPAPPSTAETGLRVSVSKVRRALGESISSRVLITQPGGYLLQLSETESDLGQFRALVAEAGRVDAPTERGLLLSQALSLWRAPPLPGPDYDAVANGEFLRLMELHDLAVGDRIDCDLEIGRHRQLVPELEALVAEAPLRERPHAQLMRALSGSGRQAEALAVYRRLRTRLVDDLGMEPSPELRELERSILAQDRVTIPRQPQTTVDPPERPHRKAVLILAAAAITACAVAVAAAAFSNGREGAARPPEELGTVARLDPQTGSVIGQMPIQARIRVGDGYGTVVVGSEIWVLNSIDHTISRIDEATGVVTETLPAGGDTVEFTYVSGELWVTNPAQNRVSRIDGETGEVVTTIPVGQLPQGIVEADGDLWVANHRGRPSGSVWRIDAETNTVLARIPVGARSFRSGPAWLASAAGSVWVGVPNLSAVVRIDPERNAVVATVPVTDGGVCGQLVADDDAVWIGSGFCGDGALTRIDPRTNEVVARIRSPRWSTVFGGALGFGSLWISTDAGPFEVDPTTNDIVGRLALGGDTVFGGNLATGAGSLWIHDAQDESLIRIDATTP